MTNFIFTENDYAEDFGTCYVSGECVSGYPASNMNSGNRDALTILKSARPVGVQFSEFKTIDVAAIELSAGFYFDPDSISVMVLTGSGLIPLSREDYYLFCHGAENCCYAQPPENLFIVLKNPLPVKKIQIGFQCSKSENIEINSFYVSRLLKIVKELADEHSPTSQNSSASGKNLVRLARNRFRSQSFGGQKINKTFEWKNIGKTFTRFLESFENKDSFGIIDWTGRFLHCMVAPGGLQIKDKGVSNRKKPIIDVTMKVQEI